MLIYSFRKKQKLIKTFFVYLKTHHNNLQPRIDVIDIRGHWIVVDEKEDFIVDKLHWFKNAITSNDYEGNWWWLALFDELFYGKLFSVCSIIA